MNNHVYTLIQQTQAPNPDTRRQSATELGKVKLSAYRQEAIAHLIRLLGDEHIAVRESAEEALIAMNGRDVVEALLPYLTSSSTSVLNYAIEILSRIGVTAIDQLLPLLESKDHDIRKFGCDILGNLGYADGVYDLIELLNDPNINVAIAAGEALGKLGNPEAVPYLIRALQHSDTWMKCIAAEALGNIGDPRAVEPFISMSSSADPLVLYAVIKAMGKLKDQRVVPHILSILRSNPMFAPSASQSLEELATVLGGHIYQEVKDAGVAAYFIDLLYTTENRAVLRSAIRLIGHFQLKDAIHPLGQLLQHNDKAIVEEASTALVRIGEAGLEEIHSVFAHTFASLQPNISEQTTEPPPTTKIPIIRVLGEIGSQRSLTLLIQTLDETIADEIRVESATALGKILRRTSEAPASPPTDPARTHALDQLLRALSDSCEALRISAAETLGDMGDPQSYPVLIDLLQDPSVDIREAASIALAKIHGLSLEEKLQPLRQLLGQTRQPMLSGGVRASVLRTLSRIAGEQEADFILSFINDDSTEVRVASIEALRTFSGKVAQYATLPDLVSSLLHDADFHIRIAALQTLIDWGTQVLKKQPESLQPSPETVLLAPTLQMLNDSQQRVQYEACQQLATLVPLLHLDKETGEQVVTELVNSLHTRETMVKIATVETLTALKPYIPSISRIIPTLQHLLKETEDPELKESLQQSLSALQPA